MLAKSGKSGMEKKFRKLREGGRVEMDGGVVGGCSCAAERRLMADKRRLALVIPKYKYACLGVVVPDGSELLAHYEDEFDPDEQSSILVPCCVFPHGDPL